jgi:alkanesulfonate monooxygenase SsuD/methylene tetrahydromethanopterin reductase-like flavin-dependent oxidoreductase (luciferase family)
VLFPEVTLICREPLLNSRLILNFTDEPPYAVARRFSTVDHLAGGRVAWNIVTSYLESAARNFGLETQVEHDERYRIADEYMDVVYKVSTGLLI